MRHYGSDELLAYLDGNDAVVDLAAVRAHLQRCAACGERWRRVERDYRLIADAEVWAEPAERPFAARVDEYLTIHRRCLEEEARAEEVFHLLRTQPREGWLEQLAMIPGARTAAMMRRLVAAARAEEEVQPGEALAVLDVAEALGALVEDERSRTSALVELRRARAMALMIRGDYPQALAALDAAERALTGLVVDYDRAFITWARATILFEMGRYAEALPLVQDAIRTFRDFGDELRETQAAILYAGVLYEQGSIDDAVRIFLSLVQPLRTLQDRTSLARVFANLACCHLQRHEFDASEAYAARAASLYAALGLEIEKIRIRWAFGRAHIRRGDVEEGIAQLHAVAEDFRARGLLVNAGEVDLEIVAAWIEQGSYEQAARVARELVAVFARAEARLDVVRALDYLRQAVERMSATTDLVQSVKYFLTHPEQPFSVP